MSTVSYLTDLFTEIISGLQRNPASLRIVENKSYISVLFLDRLICTVRDSSKGVSFTFPSGSGAYFDAGSYRTIPSDPSHIIVDTDSISALSAMKEQLAAILSSIRTACTFDICSHYMECSNERHCVVNAPYALGCSYRQKLEKGIIFYGDNRNIDKKTDPEYRPEPNSEQGPEDAITIETLFDSFEQRKKKSNSTIAFPSDYVVLDVETTGHDLRLNGIIEVAALKYRGGILVDTFTSLVRPSLNPDGMYVDPFITALTGITNSMLSQAPCGEDIRPSLEAFIGDDILIGHCVAFDIRFLSKLFNHTIENEYVDTCRLSRKLLPELEHHRLEDVALAFGITVKTAHRSLADCEATQACYVELEKSAVEKYGSRESFFGSFNRTGGQSGKYDPTKNLKPASGEIDETHIFFNKEIVFTGALSNMTRAEAMQMVVDVGGKVANNITKKTNYLVVGSFDKGSSVPDGQSNKIKKAEQMRLGGCDIQVISDEMFLYIIRESDQ